MNIFATYGDEVRYLEDYVLDDSNIDYNCDALLQTGNVYVVDHTEIHRDVTFVYLQEFPGKKFNAKFFRNVQINKEEAWKNARNHFGLNYANGLYVQYEKHFQEVVSVPLAG